MAPPVWSPNKGGVLVPHGCVLHATHGRASTIEKEFEATIHWFANSVSQVSAHIVIAADGTICACVPGNRQAWHAKTYNASHLGIEFAKRDPALFDDVLTDAQYKSAAWWLRQFNFPLDHAHLPEHREIQADKIDIGSGFDRARLMEWIGRFEHA